MYVCAINSMVIKGNEIELSFSLWSKLLQHVQVNVVCATFVFFVFKITFRQIGSIAKRPVER